MMTCLNNTHVPLEDKAKFQKADKWHWLPSYINTILSHN